MVRTERHETFLRSPASSENPKPTMYIKPLEHSRKHHRIRLRQLTREIRKERKIKYRTHGRIQGYIPEPDHRIPTPITVSNTVLSTLFFSFLLHSIAFGYNCHCPYSGKSYSLSCLFPPLMHVSSTVRYLLILSVLAGFG